MYEDFNANHGCKLWFEKIDGKQQPKIFCDNSERYVGKPCTIMATSYHYNSEVRCIQLWGNVVGHYNRKMYVDL